MGQMYEVLRQLDGELNTKRFGAVYSHICLIQLNVCSLREFRLNYAEQFDSLESWNCILNFILFATYKRFQ